MICGNGMQHRGQHRSPAGSSCRAHGSYQPNGSSSLEGSLGRIAKKSGVASRLTVDEHVHPTIGRSAFATVTSLTPLRRDRSAFATVTSPTPLRRDRSASLFGVGASEGAPESCVGVVFAIAFQKKLCIMVA